MIPLAKTCRPLLSFSERSTRRLYSSGTIKEYDIVHIRQQGAKVPKWNLTKPLLPDTKVKLGYGATVPASELIGRNYLDTLHDSDGRKLILHEPTFTSYILLSQRIATPIYPHDATTIISLLDLNLPHFGDDDAPSPPFEIFEAGTGMGSLTMHISRAIHVANPPIPSTLRGALVSAPAADTPSRLDLDPDAEEELHRYRQARTAVLHSLDRNSSHSRQAHGLVRRYRRAMYLPSVDFHVSSINDWVSSRLRETDNQPFLSRAVLDLPAAQTEAQHLLPAMHLNALLVVFAPSISQIGELNSWVSTTQGTLRLEKVLELPPTPISEGSHEGTGGRPWDVRMFVPRDADPETAAPVQVMRPKVGDRLAGGGFVAVLRKWPAETVDEEELVAKRGTDGALGDGAALALNDVLESGVDVL